MRTICAEDSRISSCVRFPAVSMAKIAEKYEPDRRKVRGENKTKARGESGQKRAVSTADFHAHAFAVRQRCAWIACYSGNIAVRYFQNNDKSTLRSGTQK